MCSVTNSTAGYKYYRGYQIHPSVALAKSLSKTEQS